jgi:hypothetical protein
MGWVLFFYDNGLTDYAVKARSDETFSYFPGIGDVYFRVPWSEVEPEEGSFQWALIDGPAQRFIDLGLTISLRFTCCEWGKGDGTPQWVRDAGAKGHFFADKKPVEHSDSWEPDYNDPVFLAKLDQFLAAVAARYDGRAEVSYVDVGSFGVWGEGHTYWSTSIPYDAETIIRHIDLHRKHFKKTPLIINDDYSAHGRGDASIEYAASLGLGLRDDSILVEPGDRIFISAHVAENYWRQAPVILESQHYHMSVRDGVWGDGSGYLRAVEAYHASYIGIHAHPDAFYQNNAALVDQINLRLGYRFELNSVTWPEQVKAGDDLIIQTSWQNRGVAHCLFSAFPAFTLKDIFGGIVWSAVDASFDLKSLLPEESHASTFSAKLTRNLRPGPHTLYVSIGSAIGTPQIELPLENCDGNKRYRVGSLEILS